VDLHQLAALRSAVHHRFARPAGSGPSASTLDIATPTMHDLAFQSVLEQLKEMPVFLAKTFAGIPHPVLCRQPSCDRSPLIEHLWHTHDCDVDLYGMRIRKVLAEDEPVLQPIDVGEWVETRDYPARSSSEAIDSFIRYREALVEELAALSPSSLQRVGRRSDGSTINVMGIIEQLAAHDRDHRWRIAAILKELVLANRDV
jgi:hypothetical protein